MTFLFGLALFLNVLMGCINLYVFAKYQRFISFMAMMFSFGTATGMVLSLYA